MSYRTKSYPTEKRMPWNGDIATHPQAKQLPFYGESGRCQEPEPHCPFCGHANYPESYESPEEMECSGCGKAFMVRSSFGFGFSTYPEHCKNDAHNFVFTAQYKYEGELVRYFYCIDCEALMSAHPSTSLMLPWLDEYDNPDTFDPDGILLPSEAGTEKPTPVLDMLRDLRKPGAWSSRDAERCLAAHERAYR